MLDVSCHKTTHNGMKTVSTMNMKVILEVMNTPSAAMRIMPEKQNSGLYVILTRDLCDIGAALYQLS